MYTQLIFVAASFLLLVGLLACSRGFPGVFAHRRELPGLRLAVVICGELRSFEHVQESITEHVVHSLVGKGHTVEVFVPISSGDSSQAAETTARALVGRFNSTTGGKVVDYTYTLDKPHHHQMYPIKFLNQGAIGWHPNIIQQLRGWKAGYNMVVKRERSLGLKYAFLARLRADLLWVKDCPDIRTFPLDVPTLPTAYTNRSGFLSGCIDDKIFFVPRNISEGLFLALDYYASTPAKWSHMYEFVTDSMLHTLGWSIAKYGSRPSATRPYGNLCGEGILAPFNYAEFACMKLFPGRLCFMNPPTDAWTGYSDICPINSTSLLMRGRNPCAIQLRRVCLRKALDRTEYPVLPSCRRLDGTFRHLSTKCYVVRTAKWDSVGQPLHQESLLPSLPTPPV